MTAMNAASRLFPILRLSNLSEHQAVRSFVCASYCKTIKTDLVWQSYPSKCMTSYNTHHSNVLQSRAIDRWTYWGSLNQTLRYSSQNHKVYTSAAQEDSSKQNPREEGDEAEKFQKLSLYGKIKSMYRDYWYVLVPVHLVSSAVFLGIFYYAASSGVDIVSIMESLHFSEKVVNTFKDSSAGFIAIAYALYKIFTPVRYTVTLGGTTWAIKLLKARGWIKPRPVKEAKENVHNIISAMKLPEKERQKFLEEKGMPRIGKAVGQASSAVSNLSSKSSKGK